MIFGVVFGLSTWIIGLFAIGLIKEPITNKQLKNLTNPGGDPLLESSFETIIETEKDRTCNFDLIAFSNLPSYGKP